MKKGAVILVAAALAGCSGGPSGTLSIRPVNEQAVAPMQDALARGDLLFSRGEYALALDAFRRAVRNDPADAHGLNGVAISYAAIGRHDLAREFFELALSRAPEDARIQRNFARSLVAQGRKADADALLAKGAPNSASRPTLAQLAASRAQVQVVGAGLELERVSLGEVRLRTQAPVEQPASAQLTTRIVTVARAGGRGPVLAPVLATPIIAASDMPGDEPAAVEPSRHGVDDGLFEKLWRSLMRPQRKAGRG
jgi:tetratricopeptide (TPR) repeat protein